MAIIEKRENGETVWEGTSDDHVLVQAICPECDKGLLLYPARYCPRCIGTGYLVRKEPVIPTESKNTD